MAFKMSPGRGSFQKTGRGVPPTLMCGSPMKQVVDATTGKTAKELAQEKLNKQMEQAGKNTGDSKNVRTFEASATAKTPGQKVEKIAKSAAEIKRWKEAKEKAKKEGKPFGEKYKAKEETATVKASDTGEDKMQPTKTDTLPTPKPKATYGDKKAAQKEKIATAKAKLESNRAEKKREPKDKRSKEEIQKAIRKANKGNGTSSSGRSLIGAKISDIASSVFKGGCKTCN